MNKNSPIGMLDSGIGGLTIAKSLTKLLPKEQIIYFGDTKNFPYGDKSNKELIFCIKKVIKKLLSYQCKIIIFACNTAYAATHEELSKILDKDICIINVIDPLINFICKDYNHQKIGLLGTKKTVSSNIYNQKMNKKDIKKEIINIATPSFAPMVEHNNIKEKEIEKCLLNEKLKNIDELILGCTHYYYIKESIKKFLHKNVKILEASEIAAQETKSLLMKKNLLSEKKIGENIFLTSQITPNFKDKVVKLFGKDANIQLSNP